MTKVIVVGAGILGASTAYTLAKRGAEVVLIDGNHEGQATAVAAGIICPWLSQRRNKAWYTLAKAGAAHYPTLIQQLKEDGIENTGYKKVGSLTLHTEDKHLEKVMERAIVRRNDAPEIGEILKLNQVETNAKFPFLDERYKSLYVTGAARVRGSALCKALIQGAILHGAKVLTGIASIEKVQGKITGVTVEDTFIEADYTVITAGAWAAEIMKGIQVDLQIKEQKAQLIHMHLPNSDTTNLPVIMPIANQYLLAFDEGQLVIGATHENEPNFDVRKTIGSMSELMSNALEIAPNLKDATYVDTKVGFRPVAPNFMPIIGRLPNHPNVLIANGLGSSGLTVGPFLGKELAKLTLGEEVSIDLALYKVEQAIKKEGAL